VGFHSAALEHVATRQAAPQQTKKFNQINDALKLRIPVANGTEFAVLVAFLPDWGGTFFSSTRRHA
jgi:hypothetical protein